MSERKRDVGAKREPGKQRISYQQLLEGYHAIIFAIQDYPDPAIPNLRTPLNDSHNLADLLVSHCGFSSSNVTVCSDSDATWDGIDDRLRGCISRLSHNDSLFVYFAGHGEADETTRESYWLPHDAQKNNRRTWYSHDRLYRTIAEYKARHVAVVSDSCFSGRLLRGASEIEHGTNDKKWLTDAVKRRSRMALTSGGEHPVSDEGAAGLSIFNLKFTEFIRTTNKKAFSLGQLAYAIQTQIPNQRVCYGPLPDEAHDQGELVLFRHRTTDRKDFTSLEQTEPVFKSGSAATKTEHRDDAAKIQQSSPESDNVNLKTPDYLNSLVPLWGAVSEYNSFAKLTQENPLLSERVTSAIKKIIVKELRHNCVRWKNIDDETLYPYVKEISVYLDLPEAEVWEMCAKTLAAFAEHVNKKARRISAFLTMVVGLLSLILIIAFLETRGWWEFGDALNTYRVANTLMVLEVCLLVSFIPVRNAIVRLCTIIGLQFLFGFAVHIALVEQPGSIDIPSIFVAVGGVLALILEVFKFAIAKLTAKMLQRGNSGI